MFHSPHWVTPGLPPQTEEQGGPNSPIKWSQFSHGSNSPTNSTSSYPQQQQVCAGDIQQLTFSQKVLKKDFNEKVCFFAFFHFNNFFVTPGHNPAMFNFWDLILSELSQSQYSQFSKTYLQNLETHTEINFIVCQS